MTPGKGRVVAALLHFCTISVGFNIRTRDPSVYHGEASAYFGYNIQTFRDGDQARILVSAPLSQVPSRNRTGDVYNCDSRGKSCLPLPIPDTPGHQVNGIGLTLATSSINGYSELLICSPSLSYQCGKNTYVNGICYHFNQTLSKAYMLKPAFEGCPPVQLDVAFLIDGSGSIIHKDFEKMQEFILKVIDQFKGKDVQFAIAQFSENVKTEFSFKQFQQATNRQNLVHQIKQMISLTHTPSGIKYVAENLFQLQEGARPKAKRLMVVITDGESNDPTVTFPEATQAAEEKGIVRYAIGVGDVFKDKKATQELGLIASKPASDFVFKVNSYEALKEIQDSLKEKIFDIEGGDSSSSRSSFEHELAQTGFSSVLTQDSILLGAVGSKDWSGEVLEIQGGRETFVSLSEKLPNTYLGYSMARVHIGSRTLLAVAGPRHRHMGSVFILSRTDGGTQWTTQQVLQGEQIGAYFGASLCAVDLDGDGETDLLLVGAPQHLFGISGGMVSVCTINQQDTFSCTSTLRGVQGETLGRFGSSIAALRDLNGDRVSDVAVGAPLEDGHRGSVYIFLGLPGGVESHFSQRIEGSEVALGLQFFGESVSGSLDLNGDGLTEVVVGARGGIIILSSSPVFQVGVNLTLSPSEIPWESLECETALDSDSLSLGASLCFQLEKRTPNLTGTFNISLDFTAQLDPRTQQRRLLFAGSGASVTQRHSLILGWNCFPLRLSIQTCIEDFVNPVEFVLVYCAQGEPIDRPLAIQPTFRDQCVFNQLWKIPYKNPCRSSSGCVTDLKLSAHISSGTLVMKPGAQLDVTAVVENQAEIGHKPVLSIYSPSGITFRKVSVVKSNRTITVICEDRLGNNATTRTVCNVGHTAIREQTKVTLVVTFDVSDAESWNESFLIHLLLSSENEQASTQHDNNISLNVTVRYRVNLAIRSVKSVGYVTLSLGSTADQEITHRYQILNYGRESLPISVSFRFGHGSDFFLWDGKVSITEEKAANHIHCLSESKVRSQGQGANSSQIPADQDFDEIDEGVVRCTVFHLRRLSNLTFVLRGKMIAKVLNQNGTGQYTIQSSVNLDFDKTRYLQLKQEEILLRANMITHIDLVKEIDHIPYIVGGSVGGFVLLLLMAVIFNKVGFFKRRYKDMVDEGNQGPSSEPLNHPALAPPEEDSS